MVHAEPNFSKANIDKKVRFGMRYNLTYGYAMSHFEVNIMTLSKFMNVTETGKNFLEKSLEKITFTLKFSSEIDKSGSLHGFYKRQSTVKSLFKYPKYFLRNHVS